MFASLLTSTKTQWHQHFSLYQLLPLTELWIKTGEVWGCFMRHWGIPNSAMNDGELFTLGMLLASLRSGYHIFIMRLKRTGCLWNKLVPQDRLSTSRDKDKKAGLNLDKRIPSKCVSLRSVAQLPNTLLAYVTGKPRKRSKPRNASGHPHHMQCNTSQKYKLEYFWISLDCQ